LLAYALELRTQAVALLRSGDHRSSELADLWVTVGRLQGVLAYAALDSGDPRAAAIHARAGFVAAIRAGDSQLAAWTRKTQALVARFGNDFPASEAFLLDGLRHGGEGTARVGLLCGLAQSRAGFADTTGTLAYLDQAARERERAVPDEVAGLFTFSEAKQTYYAASSLIWLDSERDVRRAVREARTAVRTWQTGPLRDRSVADEYLCQVYETIAHIHLGDLDAARTAVRPVLDLPPEHRFSWINKRLACAADALDHPRFHGSHQATTFTEELRDG
jgi:hypothetical protein